MRNVLVVPRALWRGMVLLYDEFLAIIRVNIVWLFLTLPWSFVVWVFLLILAPAPADGSVPSWPAFVAGLLALLLPSPGALRPAALAHQVIRPEGEAEGTPDRSGNRGWRRAMGLTLISYVLFAVLTFNLYFYAVVADGIWKVVSILWTYALILWVSMHLYLVPLAVQQRPLGLIGLYRQAATLCLAYPLYSLAFVVATGLVAGLMLVVTPIIVLFGSAYLALLREQALHRLVVQGASKKRGEADEAKQP